MEALTFNGEKPNTPGSQAPNNPNTDSFSSVTIDLYILSSIGVKITYDLAPALLDRSTECANRDIPFLVIVLGDLQCDLSADHG